MELKNKIIKTEKKSCLVQNQKHKYVVFCAISISLIYKNSKISPTIHLLYVLLLFLLLKGWGEVAWALLKGSGEVDWARPNLSSTPSIPLRLGKKQTSGSIQRIQLRLKNQGMFFFLNILMGSLYFYVYRILKTCWIPWVGV